MAITLTTEPTYPLAGTVAITASVDSAANFVRLWATAAPSGSDLRKKLDANDALRVVVATVDVGAVFNVKLDKAGVYRFTAQEYTRGVETHGGSYEGDPEGFTTETKVGSEQNLSVAIGERMTLPVGLSAAGQATLAVHVWDDTIRPTSKAIHREKTPALINPTTLRAEAATGDSAVEAAVAALEGVTVTAMTANLTTLWAELITDIPAHFNNTGAAFHANVDTDNDTVVEELPTDPGSAEGWARAVSAMAARLRLHFTNSNETVEGGARFHEPADYDSLAIVGIPSPTGANMASVFANIAAIVAAYENHRLDASVHDNADTVNTIATSLGTLLGLNEAFLEAMRPLQPTASSIQNPGAVRLESLGFTRA